MTTSENTSKNTNQDSDVNDSQGTDNLVNIFEFSSDPEYLKLIEHYQKGKFTECEQLMESLELSYPGQPELQKIREDLEMKGSVNSLTSSIRKNEALAKGKVTLRLILFGLVVIIGIGAVFFASSLILLKNRPLEPTPNVNSQLDSLYLQAEQLLQTGQPSSALAVVLKIRAFDPDYQYLPDLIERTNKLLEFEARYRTATDLIDKGEKDEALRVLKFLESESPGMWDIPQRIATIEKEKKISEYLKAGDSAYQNQEWEKVIEAYEGALALDEQLNDIMMKEQLLFAYLNRIIGMLQSDNTSIEDIKLSEEYYRKAVILIPQNKEFVSQRENLQKISRDLLEKKYTQLAKASLADKNQTTATVNEAVYYLTKALNLNPEDAELQAEVNNANFYLVALDSFIDMDWTQAVANAETVVAANADFAGGNASALLYEAYYALGKRNYNSGLYLDAREVLEKAEILAWENGDNRLKIFQVQVLLGDSIGRVGDYENGVSYYQYALNAINFQEKIASNSDLLNKYRGAEQLAEAGDYQAAFTAFQDLLGQIDKIYTISEIEVGSGVCLALFANENLSTLDAVIKANELPANMVISFGRVLSVPSIQK
jgi:tetratricopeptide (TPR) repeat protein